MKEKKVKRIIDAFSMQPYSKQVQSEFSPTGIAKIKLESRSTEPEGEIHYYVGYDFEGNVMFEYRRDTVNIEYF